MATAAAVEAGLWGCERMQGVPQPAVLLAPGGGGGRVRVGLGVDVQRVGVLCVSTTRLWGGFREERSV